MGRVRGPRTPLAEQGRIARRMASRAQSRRKDQRLDPIDLCILAAIDERTLLGYGDGRIGCKALADQVRRTTRTLRRHMARLETLGYLEVLERKRSHGGAGVNRYRVCSPKDWSASAGQERARARAARDEVRKRRGGVLTRVSPALIRGRVNARTGTGESGRAHPTVPVGTADKRIGGRIVRTGKRPRGVTPQSAWETEARWERMAAAAARVEGCGGEVRAETRPDAGEVAAARVRVGELVAEARRRAERREAGAGG